MNHLLSACSVQLDTGARDSNMYFRKRKKRQSRCEPNARRDLNTEPGTPQRFPRSQKHTSYVINSEIGGS